MSGTQKPVLDIDQLCRLVALENLTDAQLREIASACSRIVDERDRDRRRQFRFLTRIREENAPRPVAGNERTEGGDA